MRKIKKTLIIIFSAFFLLGMCSCSGNNTEASSEPAIIPFSELDLPNIGIGTDSVMLEDSVCEEDSAKSEDSVCEEDCISTEGNVQAENKQDIMPDEQLIETIRCFEQNLPATDNIDVWLPYYVELQDYCVGDVGNDRTQDIAVIVYVNPENSDYYNCVLLLFSQREGRYVLTDFNENITGYGDEVEIVDGKLYISQYGAPQDYTAFSFGYEKQGHELILCEFTEENAYKQTAQGIRIIYNLADSSAEAYAFSLREDGFEPWLIYTAEADVVTPSLKETNTDCLPVVVHKTIEYTEEGEWYNYHKFPLEEMIAGAEPEEWQLAYLDLFQYFMLEEFKDCGWYTERMWFSLVYIDDDDIPELVMVMENHFTSLYAYTPGAEYQGVQNISTIMYSWGLSRGYIGPRCYLPYENLFCFEYYGYDEEYDAFYREFWYGTTSEDRYGLEKVYDICKREFEGDYENEEDNVIKYYYNDEEITKEEYDAYLIEGEYGYLGANKYAYEIIEEILTL